VDCFTPAEKAAVAPTTGWASWEEVTIIAHRGLACCHPENTLEAIEASLAAGFNAIEVDVRTTRDGVPVLMHDETVDRTTNAVGAVEAMTFAAIRNADACPSLRDACIVPTVAEALAQVDGRALILLDLKDTWGCSRFRAVAAAIDSAGAWQDVALISSVVETFDMARQLSPSVPLAYYWVGQPNGVADPVDYVARLGSAELMLQAEVVTAGSEELKRATEAGLPVIVWTARTSTRLRELWATPGVKRVLSDVVPEG
jgi:glycerophosphoryl diester phosphodiesterase